MSLDEDLRFWIDYYTEDGVLITKVGEVLNSAKQEIDRLKKELNELSKSNEMLKEVAKGIIVHDSQTR